MTYYSTELRKYFDKAMTTASVVGASIHFSLVFYFLYCGIEEMMIYNIASTVFFVICFFLLRKSMNYSIFVFILAALEVLAHALLATYFIGVDSGFYLFMWVIIPVMVLNHSFRFYLSAIVFSLILLVQASVFYLPAFQNPLYELDSFLLVLSSFIVIVSVFLTVLLVVYYYRQIVIVKTKQMQREMQMRAATNLQMSNRVVELEEMVQSVAHDIKGPLNNISQLTEIIKSGIGSSEDSKNSMLTMIGQSSDSLREFINDLMSYSMIGKGSDQKSVITLSELFAELKTAFGGGDKVYLDFFPEIEKVNINRIALKGILYNLIDNAIKYNDKQKTEIQVEVGLSENGESYKVEVIDNGPGIAPEDIDRIFELFEVAQNKDKFGNEGTGFGLASVKKTVQSFGGTISCESYVGRGSSFCVLIPK